MGVQLFLSDQQDELQVSPVFVVAVALMPTAHSNRGRMTPSRLKELKERLAARCRSGTCPKTKTSTDNPCELDNLVLQGPNRIEWIEDIPSWSECQQQCANNTDCESFTLYPSFNIGWNQEVSGSCVLNSGVPDKDPGFTI